MSTTGINWIDIDEYAIGQAYFLEAANRWYAIALLAQKLGWEY